MPQVLITAFEPYGCWQANSSWLTLVELTKDLPENPRVTTRLYPVDFQLVRRKLSHDLAANYDFALHLGQSPGSATLQLESIGINVGGNSQQRPDEFLPLVEDGPVAYRSTLPLAAWASKIRGQGIPAKVSYHAGTYLCNATLYLTHYLAQQQGRKTQATFIHLPLDPSQTLDQREDLASVPISVAASAVAAILEELPALAERQSATL